jgi:hypothetical protein
MSSSKILLLYVHQYTFARAARTKLLGLKCNYEEAKGASIRCVTFHVIIERTLITPSDAPNATRGASLEDDLERNSILQKHKHDISQNLALIQSFKVLVDVQQMYVELGFRDN